MSDKIERAARARQLIEEGEFKTAFDKLRSDYIDELLAANTVDAREDIHRRIKIMDDVTLELISVITSGEIEERNRT